MNSKTFKIVQNTTSLAKARQFIVAKVIQRLFSPDRLAFSLHITYCAYHDDVKGSGDFITGRLIKEK